MCHDRAGFNCERQKLKSESGLEEYPSQGSVVGGGGGGGWGRGDLPNTVKYNCLFKKANHRQEGLFAAS